ncbi:MAG: hypothetical protein CVV61_01735, partial [Tenericutes bacterium HGW-Tenericutes-6]
MINQLPILQLLLFLGMALSIPLLRKRRFNTTLRLGFIVLCLVLISSVFIYIHVISEGPILYYFGNHAQRLG